MWRVVDFLRAMQAAAPRCAFELYLDMDAGVLKLRVSVMDRAEHPPKKVVLDTLTITADNFRSPIAFGFYIQERFGKG